VTTLWTAVLLGSLGCYAIKLAGLSVPARVLGSPRVERLGALLPVALLAALTATQTFATARGVTVDARAAGLAVALVAVLLRAPFLVVVVVAAGTTALLRLL
jgi:branched-subunit amino acid transport protein